MTNATLDAATITSPEAPGTARPKSDVWLVAAYGVALAACISVWFLAVRAPLWTDETLSYWQIAGGFRQIWSRSIQGNSFAAYAYILWLTNTLFGSRGIVLRVPSILAMLAAVYVFYRCARELFDWDVALIATVCFILPRGIAFAAIDVRPYSFALLVTNLTIFLFLRWMKTGQTGYAALMGIAAAGIFYFHYLFSMILLALAVSYLLTRATLAADRPAADWHCVGLLRHRPASGVAAASGTSTRRATTHSFADPPQWKSVVDVLNPGTGQLLVLAGALLLAIVARQLLITKRELLGKLLLCASLALVPIFCLYAVSVTTSVHVFIPRYLLVATPGIALCWGWLCSLIDSRALRSLFCFAFVALCVGQAYSSPISRRHEESWKESLAFADANAANDHAPLLMCSPLIEADFQPMPAVASQSVLYAPLSYYKVSAPVVPLPRTLNAEAERQATQFLLKAAPEHTRFLVLAPWPSLRIVDLLTYDSQATYTPRVLGKFDEIWVVEFVPNSDAR